MQWMVRYDPLNEIIPGLYLGNIVAASDANILSKFGITHIIRAIKGDFGKVYYDKLNYDIKKLKIIQIDDMPRENIQKYFESSYQFIEEALSENQKGANNRVLVHCQVGMSRSASIVISYLMKKFPEMTSSKALRFVKSKRPIVSPNDGFLRQLKAYERVLEKSRLVERTKAKITYDSPVKSGPKFESHYDQNFEKRSKEELKNFGISSGNYHYSRGVSAHTNFRGNFNLPQEHKIQETKEYFASRHKSNVAMNAEKSILEQSLKINAQNKLQNNGIDTSRHLRPNYEIARDYNGYSMIYNGHNLKNQQVFSSPTPYKKEPLLPLRSDRALNYKSWVYSTPQKASSKISTAFDSVGKPYGQIQPPPYRMRQMPYTSVPRKVEQLNGDYFAVDRINALNANQLYKYRY